MKLDTHYGISAEMAMEMAKKPKKEIYKWLWELPIFTGIYIEIRKQKINQLVDEFKTVHKAKKSLDKTIKDITNDFKQPGTEPSKSKPRTNKRANAADNSDGSND